MSVGEFLELINNTISQIGIVRVQGEISGVSLRDKYAFFSLKDTKAGEYIVECFIGWYKYSLFKHLLEDGLEVVVSGFPGVYKTGRFRIEVEHIEPKGEGALLKAFEVLKKKLAMKGFFDEERKRSLPELIQKIGLITSEAGAAITDFRKNLGEYGFKVYLHNVFVEGDYAEGTIIKAIEWFNRNRPDMDVLVLIRGGGSLESLKAFNSEKVADAVVTSRLPIITGIGHEKDETIAGYIADRNFSTPTAAAVFIRNQRENLIAAMDIHARDIVSLVQNIFESGKQVLDNYFLRLAERHQSIIREQYFRIDALAQKCFNSLERQYSLAQKRMEVAEAAIISLNPETVLERGYSITYRAKNKRVLKQAEDTEPGEEILTKLSKGTIVSEVRKTE